ncbi:hypothetical protein [Arsenophonus sp.]|uniref:hypothetical protein n=1 Tax=Arsenophonus sp. TaxID=1872640 RepID=UPI002866CC90|nr:hypothetical protein [Arsenophonus sp.]MDR5616630.1 hypothetical protein [Arsenophonus sp.]
MHLKISKKIIPLIFGLCTFKISLDISYILFVSRYFEYRGFDLNISILKYLLSWISLLIVLPFAPYYSNKPSNYFILTIILSLIIPLTSIYGLSSRNIDPLLITIFCFFIIYFILKIKLVNRIKPYYIKNGNKIAVIISLFFILLVTWWYFFSGAYKYFNLDFTKVYQFRELSNKLASVGIMSYINGWVYKVFIVYLMAYALLKRNFAFFMILFFIEIFFYSISGQKSVFFTPILIFSIWFYLKNFKTLLILPIGFTIIIIISYYSFLLFDDMLTPSMFIRRVFFVPAKLSYDYFDFFAENHFIYWSNSFLSHFIEYPYSLPLAELIGNYEGTGSHANNGFIASGYAHFGLVGVMIYAVILGFILKILDYIATRGVPVWFVLCVVVVPLRDALISSDLLTTLLTHGLIIALILLFLSIDNNKIYYKK